MNRLAKITLLTGFLFVTNLAFATEGPNTNGTKDSKKQIPQQGENDQGKEVKKATEFGGEVTESIEIQPNDSTDSVSKYNFIFYFLYKYKYEDAERLKSFF